MPSTYAHYRFGEDIKRQLYGREKLIIEKYQDLFEIGLHGPDILFYFIISRLKETKLMRWDIRHMKNRAEIFLNML